MVTMVRDGLLLTTPSPLWSVTKDPGRSFTEATDPNLVLFNIASTEKPWSESQWEG
jgi:hypothetical protein